MKKLIEKKWGKRATRGAGVRVARKLNVNHYLKF